MNKPILILITGEPVPAAQQRRGDFVQMITEAADGSWDGSWQAADLRVQDELPDPRAFSGVIVSGSPARLMDKTDWMVRGLEYLRLLVQANTPTLGICFGHQMLGEALGGRVGVNPKGREIGTVDITYRAENPLLDDLPPVRTNASHLDSVNELPKGAEVFASTRLESHAGVRFSERAWGVQFHPEMDAEIVREYILARQDAISVEGSVVQELLDNLDDSRTGRRVIANFVTRVVKG